MSAEPLEIECALTLGANHTVGRYRYDLATGEWWWSDDVYRIHGFEPGDVVPSTALILAHKHPEDRSRVSRILAQAAETGEPFSSVHRIMDAKGVGRTLTVIGQGRRDPRTGRVTELAGYFVDVTAGISRQANEAADTSIRASAATRAPIEQAKGIVAVALGVDPEQAFEHMRVTSNVTNVAVREVARQIVGIASAQGTLEDVRTFLAPTRSTTTTTTTTTTTGNELVDAMATAGVPMKNAQDVTVAELLLEAHQGDAPVIAAWIRRAYIAGVMDADPGTEPRALGHPKS